MALIEYRLDGTVNKVELAIKRIQLSILSEEPLYVCYSGGKDSKVIRHLMGMSGVPHELHYNLTTVDIPSVVREIMDDKEVIVEKARYADGTQKTMWNLIVKKHMPPARICRYCCSELKEASGKGRICVTGVRAAESFSRAKNAAEAKIFGSNGVELIHNMDNAESRRMIERCFRTKKTLINPIIDWTDDDIWEFSKVENIKQNPLYIQCGGIKKRLGCILCPMARIEDRLNDLKDYPKIVDCYIQAFDKMLENMHYQSKLSWKNGTEVMDWWLYGKKELNANQMSIDDYEELDGGIE